MPDENRPSAAGDEGEPVIIRKYANRRLYNTGTTAFVTLDDIRKMVVAGEHFVVVDAKTGRDITSSILAQIVAEHETRGEALLPHEVLRQIISAYEQGVSTQLSDYLKTSMATFTDNWRRFDQLGEIGRQNLEVFRDSMTSIFAPPSAGAGRASSSGADDSESNDGEAGNSESDDDLADQVRILQQEIRDLQRRLGDVAAAAPRKKPRGRKK